MIASNPKAPTEILCCLAEDKDDKYVRVRVAGNPNAPIRLLRQLVEDEDDDVRIRAKQRMFAMVEQGCLKTQVQNLLELDEHRDYMNLTCEDLALWLIGIPSREATVTLPAHLLDRKDLLGAIMWLCRGTMPSLEEAQSHNFYAGSTEYRAALAAVYVPSMTWFEAQMYASHLLRPIYPQQNRDSSDDTAHSSLP